VQYREANGWIKAALAQKLKLLGRSASLGFGRNDGNAAARVPYFEPCCLAKSFSVAADDFLLKEFYRQVGT
jgi:hypothetical protein